MIRPAAPEFRERRQVPMRALLVAALVFGMAIAADARSGWFPLEVPGGRTTLAALDVAATRERSAVMIELIRRLHFSTNETVVLIDALRAVKTSPPRGPSIVLPSPLPAAAWAAVLQRSVPADRLFAEILNDPNARLLFHGLSGMDAETRAWIVGHHALLRRLYQHDAAVSAFAMFAPAIVIRSGRLDVPGGADARGRWSGALGASPDQPERFVTRLLEDRDGRSAGLYFVAAQSPPHRQQFIVGSAAPLKDLLQAFARCYPSHSNAYPFVLRSHDAALLLLDVPLDSDGRIAGPRDAAFWSAVLDRPSHQALDALSMIETLCAAESDDRRIVFETYLAALRVFTPYDAATRDDAIAALRARRLYPALFMSVEQAGVTSPAVYAAVMRHADRVAAADDPGRAITATRLFQGAVALIVNASHAGSVTRDQTHALLTALAAAPFENERYDGAIAEWLGAFVAAVRRAHAIPAGRSAEQIVAFALAGPATGSLPRVSWDGEAYVLDVRGALERRLLEVRARQGGVTLDAALELNAWRRNAPASTPLPGFEVVPADEYGEDALSHPALRDRRTAARTVDYLLAHALASWAYAPHVGETDGGAMVAGDGSLRHQLGVRLAGRARREQRWKVAGPPARGVVAGSLLALDAPLAAWSLRRLSAAAMPPRRQIGGNDLISLMLTVALVDGRQLHDEQLATIASAAARGATRISTARTDPFTLMTIAGEVGISPWRTAVLPWMAEHEPERIAEQFSPTAVARAGGLRDTGLAAWGTANIVTGCLCVAFPTLRVPELTLGRAADGIVGAQSSDLMLRIATLLAEMKMPGGLAAAVLSYAMRDFLDHVQPHHPADVEAFERQARAMSRRQLEDYLSAIATVGPLRPVTQQ